MRRFYLLLFASLAILGIGYLWNQQITECAKKKVANTGVIISTCKKQKGKKIPNEFEFVRRSQPGQAFDLAAYEKGIREVYTHAQAERQKNVAGFQESWTTEGPGNIGGRMNVVVADPNDSDIIYTGASQGGVFKTTDGGQSWTPIFDDQPFISIGAIALDPNNSDVVYVGTGDLNISISVSTGNGLYKSEDAGQTWQHLGLTEQKIISSILIDPNDSNIMYVGSMGNPFERDNRSRGLFRTIDGGQSWEQVLSVDNDAGIIDMVMSPFNSNVIYAAAWNRVRNLTESIVNGEDANVYKTTDGGNTWNQLLNGLPDEEKSRIGLAISHVTPDVVFAVYVGTNQEIEQIYKTSDGGQSWNPLPSIPAGSPLGGFGWFFGKVAVNPENDDEIFLLGVGLHRTQNGGTTWQSVASGNVHADKHSLFFVDAKTLLLGTDGGLYKSLNNGNLWTDIENIPNSQFYRIAINPHEPGIYYGGMQDNGTSRGNANIINAWPRIFGADGFQPAFHPTDPDIFYVETQFGDIYKTSNGGTNFSYTGGYGADRTNWDVPYIVSVHNPDDLYVGTYRIRKKTANGSWEPISPDLTDGNIFGGRFHVVSAVAESPLNANYLYAGTSDGNVWRSLDGGNFWENITQDLPDFYVTSIKCSPNFESVLYVTISGYKGNAYVPHVFRSEDFGESWEDISGDLPQVAANDILILPENKEEDVLFIGADGGVFASLNAGNNWQRLGNNMPFVTVYDIDYDSINHKLIAGTFARSMMSYPLDSLINYDVVSSVEEIDISKNNKIKLYPNPVQERFWVELPADIVPTQHEAQISIAAMNGQIMQQFVLPAGQTKIVATVGDLPRGIYLLKVRLGEDSFVKNFVKSN